MTFVISTFLELQDLILLSYENGAIDDNQFLVLHIPYEEYDRFSLEGMNDAEFSSRYYLTTFMHGIKFYPKII